eukprot:752717-Hanusia_phi.AAC.1
MSMKSAPVLLIKQEAAHEIKGSSLEDHRRGANLVNDSNCLSKRDITDSMIIPAAIPYETLSDH